MWRTREGNCAWWDDRARRFDEAIDAYLPVMLRHARGWILGAVIVWLVTALGTILLPMIFFTREAKERRGR